MRREDKILKEYFKDEVSRIQVREMPAADTVGMNRNSEVRAGGVSGRFGLFWADLLGCAALAVIVLLPHVVTLPPPTLAVRTGEAYQKYLQQPSALRVHTQTFVNSLKSYFGEE